MRINIEETDYDEVGYLCLYKGKPFTGEVVQALPDGQLLTLTNFRDGLEEGPEQYWHLNGKLEYQGQHRKGEPIGTHLRWHENGVLARKSIYGDEGSLVYRQEWDENGIPLLDRVESELIHFDGSNDDIHVFQGNPFNGESVTTDERKNVVALTTVRNGLKDGPYRTWYDNGQLKTEGQHNQGLPVGVQLKWHKNGQLSQKTTYNEHSSIVSVLEWDEEGNLLANDRFLSE